MRLFAARAFAPLASGNNQDAMITFDSSILASKSAETERAILSDVAPRARPHLSIDGRELDVATSQRRLVGENHSTRNRIRRNWSAITARETKCSREEPNCASEN